MKLQLLKSALTIFISTSFLLACADGEGSGSSNAEDALRDSAAAHENRAVATISGTVADTVLNGSAIFEALENGKVRFSLTLNVPSKANSTVAVHIHEHGDCGDMGNHAGGHWNPTGTDHGKWGEGSFHSGDIGNIEIDGSGNATIELESDLWSVGGSAQTDVLNKTIVVHSGVDDYKSQPAGNSGPRIGCGIIIKSGTTSFAGQSGGHSSH